MPREKASKEIQPRARHSKVRTGCLTCKIRHKKCDEARPSCRMCTSTGRKCDGYATTIDRRTRASRIFDHSINGPFRQDEPAFATSFMSVSPVLPRQLIDPAQIDLSQNERRYLDFFRRRTSFHVAGYFQQEFWHRLVHQVIEQHAPVRHAAIAMSALHWNFEQSNIFQMQVDYSFALQQCNKAISCLRTNMHSHSHPILHTETTLITCLLFISIAFFQGDTQAVGCHLQHGSKLLRDLETNSNYKSDIISTLSNTLAHMQFHWTTFAEPQENENPPPSRLTRNYSYLYDAIDSLEKGSNFVVGVGSLVLQDYGDQHTVPEGALVEKDRYLIMDKLQHWKVELLDSFLSRGHVISANEQEIITLLELWSEIIYIQTAVFGTHERNLDNFTSNFQHALNSARELLRTSNQSSMSSFSVGTGIIQPLFFVAFKCRDWYLRREALYLLQGCHRQEGIWTSSGAAFVLERLIEIESEGLGPGDVVPDHKRVDGVSVDILPDESLIRVVYRRWGSDSQCETLPYRIGV